MEIDFEKYDFLTDSYQFEQALYTILIMLSGLLLFDLVLLTIKLIRKKWPRHTGEVYETDFNIPKKRFRSFRKIVNYFQKYSQSRTFKKIKTVFTFMWKWKILVINVVSLIISAWMAYILFAPNPKFVNLYPNRDEIWVDFDRQIEITFDRPINTERLVINMNPEIEGEWEFPPIWDGLPLSRKAVFKTDRSFYPDKRIQIYLADHSNYFNTNKSEEHLIEFYSIPLPQLVSTYPKNQSVDFPVDNVISIQLDSQTGPFVGWRVETNPSFPFVLDDFSDPQKLEIIPDENLIQGQKYEVSVFRTPQIFNPTTEEVLEIDAEEEFASFQFVTVKAPLISEMEPVGTTVNPNTTVQMVFDVPMERQSVEENFSLTPTVEGTYSWSDDVTFIFTPNEPIAKDTQYTVTLTQGLRSAAGGILEGEVTYNFKTAGAIQVLGLYPANSTQGNNVDTSIHITFDQSIDQTSAQNNFSITPYIPGTFSWQGSTMIFTPTQNLSYSTTYTYTLASGIRAIYGIDSTREFTFSFTTGSQTFLLNVPLFYQQYNFSCNLCATRMIVNYINGYDVSELDIYNAIPKETVPYQEDQNGNRTWGDPNVGYVGDINGNPKGYGVYWTPISNYLSSQGISNTVYLNWNVPGIANEIQQGNVVMLWWWNGWSTFEYIDWYTPGGKYIQAVNGMHSEVVVGFIGPVENPTHLILNDTFRGQRTLDRGYFESLWNILGRPALVAYK